MLKDHSGNQEQLRAMPKHEGGRKRGGQSALYSVKVVDLARQWISRDVEYSRRDVFWREGMA